MFYHPKTAAVGICKNCNRGLCPLCAAEVVNGIACKARCEEAVLMIDELMVRNRKVYQKSASAYAGSGWGMVLLGLPTLGMGTISALNRDVVVAIIMFVVAIGLLWAAYTMIRAGRQLDSND